MNGDTCAPPARHGLDSNTKASHVPFPLALFIGIGAGFTPVSLTHPELVMLAFGLDSASIKTLCQMVDDTSS